MTIKLQTALIFLILVSMIGCKCTTNSEKEPKAAADFPPLAPSGPLQWRIENIIYDIGNTYYIDFESNLQYTIEFDVKDKIKLDGITDKHAKEVAIPIMIYAHKHKLYDRAKIERDGVKADVTHIGVALIKTKGLITHGYRVSLPISFISELSRIEEYQE